jgi:ribosome maturation factor RimP
VDLTQAAQTVLEPLGFEVLELNVQRSGKTGNKRLVLLRIDRTDGAAVTMDDVTTATQVYGLELDRLDPFEGAYRLEVESPGPERPLRTEAHFRRFADLAAKVRVNGETFKGTIREVTGEAVTFEVGGERREVRLDDIEVARLAEWPKEPR